MTEYSVVLPAGGKGTRLRSNKPKLTTRFIDDEFLWEKQINIINRTLNNPDITYVLGFEHNKIEKKLSKYANIVINKNFEETNVAYGISLGIKQTKTPNILIIYGDLFFNEECLIHIKNSGENSFVLINRTTMEKDEVGCLAIQKKVDRFDYGFDIMWGQIAYLKESEKQNFVESSFKYSNKLGFEVLNILINQHSYFDVIEPKKGIIFDIDSCKDLNKVNRILEIK